jgi:hypothetical protein
VRTRDRCTNGAVLSMALSAVAAPFILAVFSIRGSNRPGVYDTNCDAPDGLAEPLAGAGVPGS